MARTFILSLSISLQLQKPWTQHHSTEFLAGDGSEVTNARDLKSIHASSSRHAEEKKNFGARARLPGDKGIKRINRSSWFMRRSNASNRWSNHFRDTGFCFITNPSDERC
jgi:hypothetical protein